ncbi:MAG: dihydropteroate synthase [Planctomycetota bacterium]
MDQGSGWQVSAQRHVGLDEPRLIGVLNVTPDSFSDGGAFATPSEAVDHGRRMRDEGACVIDVGGESVRPGARRVGVREQIARTTPVIERLRASTDVLISIDTTRAAVAEAALEAGADLINDVSAGTEDEGMFELAARRCCGLVLMHRLLPPQADSYSDRYVDEPVYRDVVTAVRDFLLDRCRAAIGRGVDPAAIVIDPGLGFGKTVKQNYQLIARVSELVATGYPVLSAASRKSFLGAVADVAVPRDRVVGSTAVSVAHWLAGIRLFRVHDVAAHREALAVAAAIRPRPLNRPGFDTPAASARMHVPSNGDRTMASENVLEFTDSNFDQDVIGSEVPVLVDFWADWCQPCHMLTPTIEELASEYEGKVKVGKVDTDANREVSVKYGISAIPTIILFHSGEVKKKFVGLTSKDQFQAALDELQT